MKKLLKTVAVVAAALAVGMLASCKTNVDAGGSLGGKVAGGSTNLGSKSVLLDLSRTEADKAAKDNIDWFRITKGDKTNRGPVVELGNGVDLYTLGANDALTIANNTTTLNKGSKYLFKFAEPGKYNFYYHMAYYDNDKDNPDKGERLGWFEVKESSKGKGIEMYIYDSDFSFCGAQAEVSFKVDEPKDGTSGTFWQGENADYSIREIWPLEKTNKTVDGKDNTKREVWAVAESLKYVDINITKTSTKDNKFLFPAGKDIMLSLSQPGRVNGTLRDANVPAAKLEWKKNEFYGKNVNLTQHSTTNVNSSLDNVTGNMVIFQKKNKDFNNGSYDNYHSAVSNPVTYVDVTVVDPSEK